MLQNACSLSFPQLSVFGSLTSKLFNRFSHNFQDMFVAEKRAYADFFPKLDNRSCHGSPLFMFQHFQYMAVYRPNPLSRFYKIFLRCLSPRDTEVKTEETWKSFLQTKVSS